MNASSKQYFLSSITLVIHISICEIKVFYLQKEKRFYRMLITKHASVAFSHHWYIPTAFSVCYIKFPQVIDILPFRCCSRAVRITFGYGIWSNKGQCNIRKLRVRLEHSGTAAWKVNFICSWFTITFVQQQFENHSVSLILWLVV